MPSGSRIVLREAAVADIPTPASGQTALFMNADDAGVPYYMDDAGDEHSLQGPQGDPGTPGAPGAEGTNAFHGARIFRSSTQGLTNGDYTKIGFNSTDYDSDSMVSGSSIVVADEGYYDIFAAVSIAANATGQRLMIVTRNAGSSVDGSTDILVPVSESNPGSSGNTHLAVDTTRWLDAGDVIELWVFQNSGGSLNSDVGSNPGDYVPSLGIAKASVGVAGADGADGADGSDGATGATGPAGGGVSIDYTFSTTTTDSDPGSGNLRLSNATQASATTIRADLVDAHGTDWTAVLNTLADSTNTVKGHIRLFDKADPTKWLVFTVSAVATPSGYRNITVANVGTSGVNPLANGASIALTFTRAGDVGASGTASVGSDPIWDAKGDLAGGTGTDTAARLPVGANGSLLEAASGQTTGMQWVRTLRGKIRGSDGAVLQGSGFTCVKNATGDYTITITSAFAAAPIVVGTVISTSSSRWFTADTISTTSIHVYTSSNTGLSNEDFCFIAIAES